MAENSVEAALSFLITFAILSCTSNEGWCGLCKTGAEEVKEVEEVKEKTRTLCINRKGVRHPKGVIRAPIKAVYEVIAHSLGHR